MLKVEVQELIVNNMQGKAKVGVLIIAILVVTGAIYAFQGVAMHQQVQVEEQEFHELQNEYWTISKTERDAAPTGSELNQQLAQIKNFPSTLLTLKLVGVGNILAGIFLVLVAIVIALLMMPVRLGKKIKEAQKNGQKM